MADTGRSIDLNADVGRIGLFTIEGVASCGASLAG